MCGIGGFLAQRPVDPRIAAAMQAALRPRGPDAEHRSAYGNNLLLHARLSIIDPRPEADQPMANEAGDIWICYNGEVYDWAGAAAQMAEAARRLARGGADCLVICSNTMHRMAGEVEAAGDLPLIHIADATAAASMSRSARVFKATSVPAGAETSPLVPVI